MDISVPKSEQQDISSFGFDQTLNIPVPDNSSPMVYNAIQDAIQAQQQATGGSLTLKTLNLQGFSRMAAPGDDLQAAINSINSEGGGTLLLESGTYNISTALTGYSSLTIEGVSAGSTILNFQGSANLSFTGTNVYTTGTITSIAF